MVNYKRRYCVRCPKKYNPRNSTQLLCPDCREELGVAGAAKYLSEWKGVLLSGPKKQATRHTARGPGAGRRI